MKKYTDKGLKPRERAAALLQEMTLREKVGQLAQPFQMFREYELKDGEIVLQKHFTDYIEHFGGIGTVFSFFRADPWSQRDYSNGITAEMRRRGYETMQRYLLENTRLGIPALFEENAPHGLQVLDSVLYPVNLGVGASFDMALSHRMGACIARESKSFGVDVPNASLFDMACDSRFGRTEECLSEDPYLAASLTGSIVRGYKDGGSLLCCKHFCAQGAAIGGHCGGNASIGTRELEEIHLPSVRAAVKNGVDFIMVTYNVFDGVRSHINHYLLHDVLQQELGFDGVIRADRQGCDFLQDRAMAGAKALNAGIMLGLGDTALSMLEEAVERGCTDEKTIDEAVLHVLTKKYASGIMDEPLPKWNGQNGFDIAEAKRTAYDVAAESLVLLKNNGALPFDKALRLAVFGEHADSVYPILGDYTPPQRPGTMQTLFEALKAQNPQTIYTKGWDFLGGEEDFENAIRMAQSADAIILCLGGSSARDFDGSFNTKGQTLASGGSGFMDCGEGRDVCDLSLPGSQIRLLRRLKEIGKPIISVVFQGRAYLLNEAAALSDALIVAWYPGQEGPHAIADTLFGKCNAFGRMPLSVPNATGACPVCYNHRPMNEKYVDLAKLSDYPFGSGLNYSDVRYDNFRVESYSSAEEIRQGKALVLAVDVYNNSEQAVNEVSMLFMHASYNDISGRVRELKSFQRVPLAPREKKTVFFSLTREELQSFIKDGQFEVESCLREFYAGGNPEQLRMLAISI